jgi:hypothetical protein
MYPHPPRPDVKSFRALAHPAVGLLALVVAITVFANPVASPCVTATVALSASVEWLRILTQNLPPLGDEAFPKLGKPPPVLTSTARPITRLRLVGLASWRHQPLRAVLGATCDATHISGRFLYET